MKKIIVLMTWVLGLSWNLGLAQTVDSLIFYDAVKMERVEMQGRLLPVPRDTTVAGLDYGRIAYEWKDKLRKELWELGLDCAGMCLRFRSNTTALGFKWQPLYNAAMNHMAATGVRGLDVYVWKGEKWFFCGQARPLNKPDCAAVACRNMDGTMHEFCVYLPLYDGLKKLEIGIMPGSEIEGPVLDKPAGRIKPVIFYGTSITQGGCVSRPGMSYTAQFGRMAGVRTVNLGFSGNARMDKSIEAMLAASDGSCYFIDCMANCTSDMVAVRGLPFMEGVLKAHPGVPVFMVAHQMNPTALVNTAENRDILKINAVWQKVYETLLEKGYANLYFIPASDIAGDDGEQTVDGVHHTDLGALRMAQCLYRYWSSLQK